MNSSTHDILARIYDRLKRLGTESSSRLKRRVVGSPSCASCSSGVAEELRALRAALESFTQASTAPIVSISSSTFEESLKAELRRVTELYGTLVKDTRALKSAFELERGASAAEVSKLKSHVSTIERFRREAAEAIASSKRERTKSAALEAAAETLRQRLQERGKANEASARAISALSTQLAAMRVDASNSANKKHSLATPATTLNIAAATAAASESRGGGVLSQSAEQAGGAGPTRADLLQRERDALAEYAGELQATVATLRAQLWNSNSASANSASSNLSHATIDAAEAAVSSASPSAGSQQGGLAQASSAISNINSSAGPSHSHNNSSAAVSAAATAASAAEVNSANTLPSFQRSLRSPTPPPPPFASSKQTTLLHKPAGAGLTPNRAFTVHHHASVGGGDVKKRKGLEYESGGGGGGGGGGSGPSSLDAAAQKSGSYEPTVGEDRQTREALEKRIAELTEKASLADELTDVQVELLRTISENALAVSQAKHFLEREASLEKRAERLQRIVSHYEATEREFSRLSGRSLWGFTGLAYDLGCETASSAAATSGGGISVVHFTDHEEGGSGSSPDGLLSRHGSGGGQQRLGLRSRSAEPMRAATRGSHNSSTFVGGGRAAAMGGLRSSNRGGEAGVYDSDDGDGEDDANFSEFERFERKVGEEEEEGGATSSSAPPSHSQRGEASIGDPSLLSSMSNYLSRLRDGLQQEIKTEAEAQISRVQAHCNTRIAKEKARVASYERLLSAAAEERDSLRDALSIITAVETAASTAVSNGDVEGLASFSSSSSSASSSAPSSSSASASAEWHLYPPFLSRFPSISGAISLLRAEVAASHRRTRIAEARAADSLETAAALQGARGAEEESRRAMLRELREALSAAGEERSRLSQHVDASQSRILSLEGARRSDEERIERYKDRVMRAKTIIAEKEEQLAATRTAVGHLERDLTMSKSISASMEARLLESRAMQREALHQVGERDAIIERLEKGPWGVIGATRVESSRGREGMPPPALKTASSATPPPLPPPLPEHILPASAAATVAASSSSPSSSVSLSTAGGNNRGSAITNSLSNQKMHLSKSAGATAAATVISSSSTTIATSRILSSTSPVNHSAAIAAFTQSNVKNEQLQQQQQPKQHGHSQTTPQRLTSPPQIKASVALSVSSASKSPKGAGKQSSTGKASPLAPGSRRDPIPQSSSGSPLTASSRHLAGSSSSSSSNSTASSTSSSSSPSPPSSSASAPASVGSNVGGSSSAALFVLPRGNAGDRVDDAVFAKDGHAGNENDGDYEDDADDDKSSVSLLSSPQASGTAVKPVSSWEGQLAARPHRMNEGGGGAGSSASSISNSSSIGMGVGAGGYFATSLPPSTPPHPAASSSSRGGTGAASGAGDDMDASLLLSVSPATPSTPLAGSVVPKRGTPGPREAATARAIFESLQARDMPTSSSIATTATASPHTTNASSSHRSPASLSPMPSSSPAFLPPPPHSATEEAPLTQGSLPTDALNLESSGLSPHWITGSEQQAQRQQRIVASSSSSSSSSSYATRADGRETDDGSSASSSAAPEEGLSFSRVAPAGASATGKAAPGRARSSSSDGGSVTRTVHRGRGASVLFAPPSPHRWDAVGPSASPSHRH